jgi:hypothetical protein
VNVALKIDTGPETMSEGVAGRAAEAIRKALAPAQSMLQFFAWEHLPPHLADVSKPFGELAAFIATLPSNAESTMAQRKLLEAKDCAVRAVVAK